MKNVRIEENNIQKKGIKEKENSKSKWLKLKYLLQDKASFESSVKLLKKTTIEQFASKCCEIYKEKINIHLLLNNNQQIFASWIKNKNKEIPYHSPNVEVRKDLSDLCGCYDNSIQDFLFYLRENNEYMLNVIKYLSKEKRKVLVPFLCHFFYENFFMDTPEQEEIFYIIYLLLEKEVDSLNSPSIISFLGDTFLGEFFGEMRNKYEINKYIDNILNYLIREIEEKNSSFLSLDIINNSKNHYESYRADNTFFDMNNQDNLSSLTDDMCKKIPLTILDNYLPPVNKTLNKRKTSILTKSFNIKFKGNFNSATTTTTFVNNIKYENNKIKSLLNKNFYENIDDKYLKKLLENEKNEIMKIFYIKQIKIINSNNDPNFFNSNNYYEKMKANKIISKLSIQQFNKTYEIVTQFIDNLLSNLEKKIMIPYSIKAICMIINELIKRKFKNISKILCNALICRFLFDKLLLPVLENPDINNAASNMILSLNTRKILMIIDEILKKLIRGELFNCHQNENYTVFNKFILQNFNRINNIISNIIEVKLPEKIILLINQFYNNDRFDLEKVVRSKNDINYNYFDENPKDFMQHKSICFNINQLLLLYGIVHMNQKVFLKDNPKLTKIINLVTKHIPSMKCSVTYYYVIIKDEYKEEIKDLIFFKEKNISLNKPKNPEETLYKLKYCIRHLFDNFKILHSLNFFNEDYNTLRTFQYIHQYLTFYRDKSLPPLNWYSQFILNNLNGIKKEYSENDYTNLYVEIETDVRDLIKKLKKLNAFLTVNMTTKFFLIENKKKCFHEELEKVKKTELNIKALLFIELNIIKICLMKGFEYNRYRDEDEEQIDDDALIICKQRDCPHSKLTKSFVKMDDSKNFHCKNVKEFADKFCIFHKYISDEINNYNSFGPEYSNEKYDSTNKNKNKINRKNLTITCSPKKILETYMKLVNVEIQESIIFNSDLKDGFEIINSENEKKKRKPEEILKMQKEKEEMDKATKIVWNYILKSLCNKIYESPPLIVDQVFNLRCESLACFIKPKNLQIPEEIVDEHIIDKIKYHLERIDELRTPGAMLEEFGIVVSLINILYKFLLNQNNIEAGDLLPIIIYCMIYVKPKRMTFNINFIKFFLNENELLGGIGYNIVQAASAINFIKNLEPKQIGLTQEEFNKLCSSANIL